MLSMETRNAMQTNENRYEAKGVANGSIRVFIFHKDMFFNVEQD